MSKFDIPQLHCWKHKSSNLTAVCLAPKCDRRLLCPKCFHDIREHSKHIIAIDGLMNSLLVEKIRQYKQREEEDVKFITQLEEEVDQVCDRVISACVNFINIQRDIMKSQLYQQRNPVDRTNWNDLEAKIKDLQCSCLSTNASLNNINELAKAQAEIELKLNKQNELSRKRRGKLLVYHEEVNHALEQIHEGIRRLPNSLIKSFSLDNEIENFKKEKFNLSKQLVLKRQTCGHSIEFVQSKNMIALGDMNGNLSLWDATNFKLLSENKVHKSWISNIKFNKKTNTLFTSTQALEIKAFTVNGNGSIKMTKRIKEPACVYSILPIDHHNILATAGRGNNIKIYNLKTLAPQGHFDTGDFYGVGYEMTYIPKYEILAAGFYNGGLGIFDISSREMIISTKTKISQAHVNAMAFIDARDYLFSAQNGTISVWKLDISMKSLNLLREIKVPGAADGLTLKPINNGSQIIYSGSTNQLYSINVEKSTIAPITSLDFNSSFVRVLPNSRKMLIGTYTNRLQVFNY